MQFEILCNPTHIIKCIKLTVKIINHFTGYLDTLSAHLNKTFMTYKWKIINYTIHLLQDYSHISLRKKFK